LFGKKNHFKSLKKSCTPHYQTLSQNKPQSKVPELLLSDKLIISYKKSTKGNNFKNRSIT